MKYTGPKVRLSRRFGLALTPKATKYMERKPYGPGQHGQAQMRFRGSAFKAQLMEKQKLKAQYNLTEKQMTNYFQKAVKQEGNTVNNLFNLLESRLDAVVLRSGLAKTIYAARQFVNHGHVKVNGQRVNIPSFQVNVGDEVVIKEKSRQLPAFMEAKESKLAPPPYLLTDYKNLSVAYSHLPSREEIPVVCEASQVIEYYSR